MAIVAKATICFILLTLAIIIFLLWWAFGVKKQSVESQAPIVTVNAQEDHPGMAERTLDLLYRGIQ
jgi:hypothetical protein